MNLFNNLGMSEYCEIEVLEFCILINKKQRSHPSLLN